MRDRRWLPELDEHARDLHEADIAYDAWLQGKSVPAPHYPYAEIPDDLPILDLNEFCERDPFDRLKSEGGGGHLGE